MMSVIDRPADQPGGAWWQGVLARFGRSRPYRLQSGQLAIWLLSGLLIAASLILLGAGVGNTQPVMSSVRMPFWALLIAFAAAERFVIHIHFRRSAHSMSLAEIPLVFGLVFAGGGATILAGAIGRLLVLPLHRKLPLLRLTFNFGVFLFGTCVQ